MMGLQLKSIAKLAGLCLAVFLIYNIAYLVYYAARSRRRYHDIPAFPRHWLLGNLVKLGKHMDPASPRHPDYGIREMWEELGRPQVFLMDTEPIDRSFLVVTDPTIGEQVVQPSPFHKYSTLKSETTSMLWRLMGKESMLTAEGEVWKNLRRRFSKGFSPAHLHSLSSLVVSQTRIFNDRLKIAAESGEVFELREYSQDLATDIITTIAIEKDFGSQSLPEGQGAKSRFGFLTASRLLPNLVFKPGQGFNLRYFIDPIRPIKERIYYYIQNKVLDDLIWEKLNADKNTDKATASNGKAIVQLALSGLAPTPQLVANTRDQIKTFIFAGQDTTATTIQWAAWHLAQAAWSPKHAKYLSTLRAEHDAVFGPGDAFSAMSYLEDPTTAEQILGDKLPYTTAYIKEVLRLHPPAGTARTAPWKPKNEPPMTLNIGANGAAVRVDGLRLYPCQLVIQTDVRVWGDDGLEFNPDRWMDEDYVRKLPAGAWRPFERGPRNCIGQELAMLEMKVVLCAVARGFVFEKVGFTGRNGEKEVFATHAVTAVPCDGMRMRVRLRGDRGERVEQI